MEQFENSIEYQKLVERVSRHLSKTEIWVNRVLERQPDSLRKFIEYFRLHNSDASTVAMRELREELLKHCPIDLYELIFKYLRRDPSDPRAWEGFVYSPFERKMQDCLEGKEIDPEGLSLLEVSRCAIVKLTLQTCKFV